MLSSLLLFPLTFFLLTLSFEESQDHHLEDDVYHDLSRSNVSPKRNQPDSEYESMNITVKKPKTKVREVRPPGYQSQVNRLNRKIVGLLKERNNGIRNYNDAKKAANLIFDKERENARMKYKIFRKTNPPKKFKPRPLGYGKKESIIKRFSKTISNKDPNLSIEQVKKLAEEKYFIQRRKSSAYEKERKRKKRENLKNKQNDLSSNGEIVQKQQMDRMMKR